MTTPSGRVSVDPRLFATIGLAAAIVGAIGTIVVRLIAPAPFIGGFGFGGATMVGYLVQGLTWASVGTLLVVRRPGNAVGWLMVLVGAGYALSQLSVSMTFSFAAEGSVRGDRLAQIAGWVTVLLQLVTILHFAIGFVFPSGRVQSRRWEGFMRLFWAFAVVFVVTSLLQPGPLQLIPAVMNPFGFGPDLRGGRPIAPILALAAVIILVSVAISMVSRYRSGGRIERLQLKWFVLALGVSAIGLGITTLEAIFNDRPENAIGLTVYVFAGGLVPIAIGIAILRYRLYDIDRIISRTLAYGLVTAVLVAVFGGLVLGIQTVLAPFVKENTIAVAASTLVVFALFQPLRRGVQRAVDRRFHRARIDAERTTEAFAGRLRDQLDLESLARELTVTAEGALRPSATGVWLRGAHR